MTPQLRVLEDPVFAETLGEISEYPSRHIGGIGTTVRQEDPKLGELSVAWLVGCRRYRS
jgi:hypothetical protein